MASQHGLDSLATDVAAVKAFTWPIDAAEGSELKLNGLALYRYRYRAEGAERLQTDAGCRQGHRSMNWSANWRSVVPVSI